MLNSYRSRLIALMAAALILMAVVILTSYTGARWAIQEDAATNLRNSVQLYEHSLDAQRIELARYAATVRDDAELGEYTFASVRIGAGSQALERFLKRRFPRIPVDAIMVFWDGGKVSLGSDAERIADEVSSWPSEASNSTFYVERDDTQYLVAVVPLEYRKEQIAQVAVAINLGTRWLSHQDMDLKTQLFFERNGKIFSDLSKRFEQVQFDPEAQRIQLNGEFYQLAAIRLPAADGSATRLWLAQLEVVMLETLDRYNEVMIWLAIIVFSIMVPAALVAVNRFSRPVHKLISLTQQMADGQLPDLRRSQGYTEIDKLLNHFIDLIAALRRKQEEVEKAHEALLRSSITDELTGLYNRRHLNEVFPKMLAQADRDNSCIAVILLDIDHFKRINDTFGHYAGDRCLRAFSDGVKRIVRASDFVFRMGGEEFMILAAGHCGQDAALLAEKVRLATENCTVTVDGEPVRFTVSAGVSNYTSDLPSASGLSDFVTRADRALYEAKQSGRNCVRVYQDDKRRDKDSDKNEKDVETLSHN